MARKYRIRWQKSYPTGYVVEEKVFPFLWKAFITWNGYSGRQYPTVFNTLEEAKSAMQYKIATEFKKKKPTPAIKSIYYDEFGNWDGVSKNSS